MERQPEACLAEDGKLDELLHRTRESALRTLSEVVDVETQVRTVRDAVAAKRPESP